MLHTCERCGFSTENKRSFKSHLMRKYQCKPINCDIPQKELYEKHFIAGKFKCSGADCNVYLKTVKLKKAHEKRCQYMAEIKEARDNTLPDATAVAAATTIITTVQPQSAEVINNTTNIDNSTTINITPFGVWKDGHMQHIIKNRKFMMQCLKNKGSGLCDLLRMMHFDSNHPENHNIRKLTKKDPFIEHHDGTRWRMGLPAMILQKAADEMERVLMEFLNESIERRINDAILKSFMHDIGIPLEWDLNISDYECPMERDTRDERTLLDTKNMMMQLITRCLYEETQMMGRSIT